MLDVKLDFMQKFLFNYPVLSHAFIIRLSSMQIHAEKLNLHIFYVMERVS